MSQNTKIGTVSRRSFLRGLAALTAAAGINLPAFSSQRKPYVSVGDVANYIGPSPGFSGGQLVVEILPWDGVAFPVVTKDNGFPGKPDIYYDIDLSYFMRDVPEKFWHNPENNIYPNVHTWVRMTRYGETLRESIKKLNMANSEKWLAEI